MLGTAGDHDPPANGKRVLNDLAEPLDLGRIGKVLLEAVVAPFAFVIGKQHRCDRGAARVVGILIGGDMQPLVLGPVR